MKFLRFWIVDMIVYRFVGRPVLVVVARVDNHEQQRLVYDW